MVIVEPKVAPLNREANEDEISVYDIDPQDKGFLLELLGAPASALEKFRSKQMANVESLHPSQNNTQTPVGTANPKSVG